MKVAFDLMGGDHWTVGPVLLRDLWHALRLTYGRDIGLVLQAAQHETGVEAYAGFIGADEVARYGSPRVWSLPWALGAIERNVLSRNRRVERVLRTHGVDVLFTLNEPYLYPGVATLAWLPDLQHRYFPTMFSPVQRWWMERRFRRSARLGTRVLVLSETVRADWEKFLPDYAPKVRVLRPVSYVPVETYTADLDSIQRQYQLPAKFFYVPNQFWKHKNHRLVWRALQRLNDRGCRVSVVCTGSRSDFRHPTYFGELWQRAIEWGVRDQIQYLGLVPHDHVFLLMRLGICVVNPSTFEGWGYAADEARTVGKRLLLSDLPVHREQNPPQTIFFDPHDEIDLANKMECIWREAPPGPDLALESAAREALPRRLRVYAETFMSIAREALAQVRATS